MLFDSTNCINDDGEDLVRIEFRWIKEEIRLQYGRANNYTTYQYLNSRDSGLCVKVNHSRQQEGESMTTYPQARGPG